MIEKVCEMIAFIIILSLLMFDFSGIQSIGTSSDDNELGVINFFNNNSTEGQSMNETLIDLNKILTYLVGKVENNPIVLENREFLRAFSHLLNKVNDIIESMENSNLIDSETDENLKTLKSSKHKLNELMKFYVKTTLSPLTNTTDSTSTDSLDYWSFVWKIIDKIETQLSKSSKTSQSNGTSITTTKTMNSRLSLPSDPLKNRIIFQVLSEIRAEIASNDTLKQISDKSFTVNQLISKVVEVVDKTSVSTKLSTTSRPTQSIPQSNGLIGAIFSRFKNLLNNSLMRATTSPPMRTTPAVVKGIDSNDYNIKDIVTQVISQLVRENQLKTKPKDLINTLITN